jgi:hypothetical protein
MLLAMHHLYVAARRLHLAPELKWKFGKSPLLSHRTIGNGRNT